MMASPVVIGHSPSFDPVLGRASTEVSSSVGSLPNTAVEADHSIQTKLNIAVKQVKDICSHLSHAVKGGENQTIMGRVTEGFMAVAALGPALANVGVRFAGKGIDKLVDKHPVLAMAAGVAGLIGGIVLCTHEPFTGMALTTAAAYTILKSYKPVHEKLMSALNKANVEEQSVEQSTSGADLKSTLLKLNKGNTDTSTLVLNGEFSLADFKDLPVSPKIKKLVLPAAQFSAADVTQETSFNLAKVFPNLHEIKADGLNDLSGKIISEMLATETLKSLKLENVDRQVDTLSGPLHHISANHLTELVYSEASNNPRGVPKLEETDKEKEARIAVGFCVDMQLDKLLDTSANLKSLSLSGHFNLSKPLPEVQARCQKVHGMKALTHFEMKGSPNMAEEYLAFMISESNKLEHVNLSNNPIGVGTSLEALLGKRADDASKLVLPELKHLTFWENGTFVGQLDSQVENSLKKLGRHQERLQQLDLKVSDGVSEDAVITAIQSVKKNGKLTLGLSEQVTAQTIEKIKDQRPDLDITVSDVPS